MTARKANIDRFLQNLEVKIAEHGFAIITTGTQTSRDMLPMSYTVGLADKSLPELIVFGLPTMSSQAMLNNAAKLLMAGSLKQDTPTDEVANLMVTFKAITPAAGNHYLNVASNRAGALVHALQLVWPDRSGLFPWDEGFDEAMRHMQIALYEVSGIRNPLLIC